MRILARIATATAKAFRNLFRGKRPSPSEVRERAIQLARQYPGDVIRFVENGGYVEAGAESILMDMYRVAKEARDANLEQAFPG